MLPQSQVKWSPRMTVCAGLCSYQGRGGLCSIRLSVPLLKLRPRKDFVETLLHEMIHAYLFVTDGNDDHDGHGPAFHEHMFRINKEAGTNISVYHNFHDEVALYKTHWWKCDGPCQKRKPFYGMVKRSMNRAPGPNDRWWAEHQSMCGGTFIKVKEPEGELLFTYEGRFVYLTSCTFHRFRPEEVEQAETEVGGRKKRSKGHPGFLRKHKRVWLIVPSLFYVSGSQRQQCQWKRLWFRWNKLRPPRDYRRQRRRRRCNQGQVGHSSRESAVSARGQLVGREADRRLGLEHPDSIHEWGQRSPVVGRGGRTLRWRRREADGEERLGG